MVGLFLSLSDECCCWWCDGSGGSHGQGVDGISLAFKHCCQTLEDLVVPPGVAALCEAGLTTGQDVFESCWCWTEGTGWSKYILKSRSNYFLTKPGVPQLLALLEILMNKI